MAMIQVPERVLAAVDYTLHPYHRRNDCWVSVSRNLLETTYQKKWTTAVRKLMKTNEN